MTPEQFCYWLQGRAELRPDEIPSPGEWQSIREHLATVFNKVTPPVWPQMPTSLKHPLRVECSIRAPETAATLLC